MTTIPIIAPVVFSVLKDGCGGGQSDETFNGASEEEVLQTADAIGGIPLTNDLGAKEYGGASTQVSQEDESLGEISLCLRVLMMTTIQVSMKSRFTMLGYTIRKRKLTVAVEEKTTTGK
mmetsp:Transcript_24278/g.41247  ORF Transcript_24278/g.41247 Transcript_24278/m.41247 type:complete len:119 (-) Transcript_24278:523-879(-)